MMHTLNFRLQNSGKIFLAYNTLTFGNAYQVNF